MSPNGEGQTMDANLNPRRPDFSGLIKANWIFLALVLILVLLPFGLTLAYGDPISALLANQAGNSKFIQGLMIEIFILAIFALSYDLVFGITGLLSFGHAMFFAVGAYLTGFLLKSLGWSLLPTIGAVVLVGILQALIFSVVLPRVKGITFALVTLGLAAMFDIIIKTRELADYTGADVGLQGIPRPEFLDPADQRLRFYYLTLAFTVLVYLIYRRFVNSPTGRVCIAIRENENRAMMIGYNTFYFKLAVLVIASITAALGGMIYALFQPIVSPEIATLAFTVEGLLMILIGGIGTLSGAMVGAAAFKFMDFYLDKWFGDMSAYIIGLVYVVLVLFIPYGIVGTWRQRRLDIQAGRKRLVALFTGNREPDAPPDQPPS
jgi:branched-chain amino acid transport system permease protein